MKRFFVSAVAVVLLFFVGRWIVRAMASDETRIRWELESMAEGFNRTRTDACLDGLALDFKDETYGATREDVRLGLAHLFFEKKDSATRGFPFRVELPRDALRIDVQHPGDKEAHVELLARFFEKHGPTEEIAWETRITAQLVKRDGDWLVRRTEHKILAGHLPR